jgi:hypothetical protein
MIRQAIHIALFICFASAFPISTYSSDSINQESGVLAPDGKTVWYNGTLLGVEGKGWVNTESFYDRLPLKAKGMVRTPVWGLSHSSAGMQIRFRTDAKSIQVRWTLTNQSLAMPHMPATGVSGIDLYARDQAGRLRFCANGRPTGVINKASFRLPASKEYVLYLPLYNGVKLVEVGVSKDKSLSKLPCPSPSHCIVFYGTSITQGACASRPGMAATAIISRGLGAPIINLGFSGNGNMEKEMAELLSELDPAIYVLDCLWNMSPQQVSERVEPFITRLRETRPTTPIILAEDSSFRDLPSGKGDILRKIFEKLTRRGDKNLYRLPNKGMLGEDSDGTVDGCHPNDLGMSRQAAVFMTCLEPILKKQKSNKPDAGDGK